MIVIGHCKTLTIKGILNNSIYSIEAKLVIHICKLQEKYLLITSITSMQKLYVDTLFSLLMCLEGHYI
jgi:hypothetical protein